MSTSASLDVDFARHCFPAFREPDLQGWAHFENAGGSYACAPVIEQLERFYRSTKVQPYAWSAASVAGGEAMDRAREGLASWLNVATDELHLGPSTTQNVYVLAQALRAHGKAGDEVIVTNLDHEANVGAFRRLADDGFTVREWRFNPYSGDLELSALESLLNERTVLVAFSHCSNIVGTFNPVAQICERIRKAGAVSVVDGVSYCGHGLPDVDALGADVYLFSLYKVYGPHQGVMTMRRTLNEQWPSQTHFFNAGKPNARFVPAGPDHAQVAASGGVIDYFESLCLHQGLADLPLRARANALHDLMQAHEQSLLTPLLDFLDDHPRASLIGRRQAAGRAPTVAVDTKRHPRDIAEALAKEHHVGASAGHFYAHRCIDALGMEPDRGVLRMSFVHYTNEAEVTQLIEALDAQL
ncbi:MAG: aminotransferase class V-fold PLP-dependent enzyme [Pseudomonadota bacterium]